MTRRRAILLPAAGPEPIKPGGQSPDTNHTESLPLAAPKMFTRGVLIVCGVVAAILYLLAHEVASTMDVALPMGVWVAPLVVVAVLIGGRWLLVPKKQRVIRFYADHVELPKGPNSRRTYRVEYGDILTIVPLVSRGQPALVIEGPKKTHIFLAGDFAQPQGWRMLGAQLMERISRGPQAAQQLDKLRRMSQLSQDASSTKPRFTRYLLWGIAAIFGAQLLLSPDVDVLEYLYFGANSQVMVFEQGQWWRVITANLLHGNAVHFGVNAFALYFLGTYCERLFGESRTIVLTLGTAVAGAAASLIGTEALFAVGISTALFGLLGAYFALHLRFGRQLPPPYRQSWLWWGVILGINVVISVAVPMIDAWGHFGGFVAGVLLGWAMTAGNEQFAPRRPTSSWTNLVAAALVALFAACSVIAIGYATGDHPDDEVAFAQALEARADVEQPALMAQLAYQWSDHTPRPAALNPVLVSIAESAHQRGDDIFIQWRAAAAMVRIAEQIDEPFDEDVMRRALVRFERTATQFDDRSARQALGGVLMDWVDVHGPLYAAEAPFDEAQLVDGQVQLLPQADLEQPRRVYLLALPPDEQRRGRYVLDRCVPASQTAGAESVEVDRDIGPDRQLRVAMVADADDCPDQRAQVWRSTEITDPPEPDE